LEVALWVFSLVFVAFALRGIVVFTLLSDKVIRGTLHAYPRTLTSLGLALGLGLRLVST
jgi:hypothetical protein